MTSAGRDVARIVIRLKGGNRSASSHEQSSNDWPAESQKYTA